MASILQQNGLSPCAIQGPEESEYLGFLLGTFLYERISLLLDIWRLVLAIQSANIHTDVCGHHIVQRETVANDLGTFNMARYSVTWLLL